MYEQRLGYDNIQAHQKETSKRITKKHLSASKGNIQAHHKETSKRIKRKRPRENREGENLSWNRKERNRKGKHTYRRTEKDDM